MGETTVELLGFDTTNPSSSTQPPTHVIVQAGVGSLAGAIVEGLQQLFGTSIKVIVVEPTHADAFFQSSCSSDGSPKSASGDLSTIMAGLACREPNPLAWNILKDCTDCFVTCPDAVAAKGMRLLANPLGQDPRIISGESGAVPLGLLVELCTNPLLQELKETLQLNSSSRLFMINTEGDTDPESNQAICRK
ncbi:MAG: pyridoxal-phosphate dependent enzyme [Verrucomicrobia bacterium]|nr:pyridoxal-phosphate dependent enzyme [Verrucomicrobiota bacterium]